MKNAVLALTSIALSSLVACAPSPPANAPAATDAAAEVAAAAAEIIATFGRHDRDGYFALFSPDATFVFHSTPKRLNSRAEYEAEWARWETDDGFRVQSCVSTDQQTQLLGDAAVFTHTTRTEFSTNQGTSTIDERETIVFHRRDGQWIAVHEHVSAHNVPGQATG